MSKRRKRITIKYQVFQVLKSGGLLSVSIKKCFVAVQRECVSSKVVKNLFYLETLLEAFWQVNIQGR